MDIKYCLPITENNKDSLVRTIAEQSAIYSFFEIWLDYLDKLDPGFIQGLMNAYPGRLILLFRRKNLEPPRVPENIKRGLITSLSGSETFLDLDLFDQAADLEFIREQGLKIRLICSYHNYQKTPGDENLLKYLGQMERYSPEIYKFSCFCNEQSDSLRLMYLLNNLRSQGKKFIVLGMGEKGLITRLFGTKWGNEMLFAPLDSSKSTAPGQYTKEDYEKIFKLLK